MKRKKINLIKISYKDNDGIETFTLALTFVCNVSADGALFIAFNDYINGKFLIKKFSEVKISTFEI